MHPLVIVEVQVPRELDPRIARVGILVQLHLLIFDGPPEPFREHVVEGPSPPIHTDPHACCLEQGRVLRASKVTALIAIPDVRRRHRERVLHRRCHERLLQRLVQRPTDDVARIPIQHGD